MIWSRIGNINRLLNWKRKEKNACWYYYFVTWEKKLHLFFSLSFSFVTFFISFDLHPLNFSPRVDMEHVTANIVAHFVLSLSSGKNGVVFKHFKMTKMMFWASVALIVSIPPPIILPAVFLSLNCVSRCCWLLYFSPCVCVLTKYLNLWDDEKIGSEIFFSFHSCVCRV